MQSSKEITYSHEWINKLENELHWKLYWHQLNLFLNISDISTTDKIIEVGVGSGLVSNYLKRKGFNITTVDIDKNKNPDVVANIVKDEIPVADVYLAFEIFEHIPFDSFKKVVKKMSDNKTNKILFSVPHAYRTYLFGEFWIPSWGNKKIHIGRSRNHINTKNHHWEIGISGITIEMIKEILNESGYTINHSYRYRNHQFFSAKLITG